MVDDYVICAISLFCFIGICIAINDLQTTTTKYFNSDGIIINILIICYNSYLFAILILAHYLLTNSKIFSINNKQINKQIKYRKREKLIISFRYLHV